MSAPHVVLTYHDFGTAVDDLAGQIARDGFRPDLILAIARGGLFLAGGLGYALDVKNLFVLNVEYYTGEDERLDVPVVLPPQLNRLDLQGANVLVADDVADTGGTLSLVHEFCEGYARAVRTAVLYAKPRSNVRCQYVWRETDAWIDFPWSSAPPVQTAPPPVSPASRPSPARG